MAACIPALKQLFEKVLGRLGLLSARHPSNPRSGYVYHDDEPSNCNSYSSHKLKPIKPDTASSGNRSAGGANTSSDLGAITESEENILPFMKA